MKPLLEPLDQPRLDRRKVTIGLLFCVAAGVAAWRQPRKRLDFLGSRKLVNLIPTKIGPWQFVTASGLVVPPKDQLSRQLYSQLLTRIYSDGRNAPVMLLIAQSPGQTGILQVHRPETCYPASGYKISAVSPHKIPLAGQAIDANALTATNEGSMEQIVYWTRIGDKIPADWADQRLVTAEQNLKGVLPDAVLVRVSTVNPDTAAARATLDSFVQAMVASIPAASRDVLVV